MANIVTTKISTSKLICTVNSSFANIVEDKKAGGEGFGFQRPKFSFDPYYTYYPSVEEYKMVS